VAESAPARARPGEAGEGPQGGGPRSVLVVGPSWIGDMVMAQSLFISLQRRYAGIAIDAVAPGWSRGVVGRMPQVRESIEVPVEHGELGLAVRRSVGRRLRSKSYDRAIVLPRSLKSALVPFFAGIPVRTGYRGELRYGLINDMRLLDRSVLKQTVQQFVALGQPAGEPLPPHTPRPRLVVDELRRVRLLEELGLGDAGRPVVALVPGARYGPSKRWPPEHYGDLAARLVERGRQVWIFGSKADGEAAQAIRWKSGGKAVDLTGRTRLEDVVDLFSIVQTVVTNDTGLMHVASAVGARVVAIYGSTSPECTPPLTDLAEVLYLGLECSPCGERRCPLTHYRCVRDIRPADVLAAVDSGGS
jgi:heptosyltransferase-2